MQGVDAKRIDRRCFNGRIAASTLAACVGWSVRAGAEGSPPRLRPRILYGLSTGSWNPVIRKGDPLPLLKILDETAASGFNGVRLTGFPEILAANRLDAGKLKDELEARGLKFSTTSFGGQYHDRRRHEEILERWRSNLEVHKRLGATAAVFFPPGAVPAAEEKESFAEMCRFLDRMGKMAVEEFGIRPGLHNHTDAMVESQAQVDRFLEGTDPRYVFCAWDTAHLLLGGCDVVATYKKSIDRLVFTDFKDATLQPIGEDYVAPNGDRHDGKSKTGRFYNSMFELGKGVIDFPALMHLLKAREYKGWITHDLDTIRVSCAESWRIARGYIETRLDPIYL